THALATIAAQRVCILARNDTSEGVPWQREYRPTSATAGEKLARAEHRCGYGRQRGTISPLLAQAACSTPVQCARSSPPTARLHPPTERRSRRGESRAGLRGGRQTSPALWPPSRICRSR